ncbi:hypothetical protein ISCGN_029542 [Ixodes scapularis]
MSRYGVNVCVSQRGHAWRFPRVMLTHSLKIRQWIFFFFFFTPFCTLPDRVNQRPGIRLSKSPVERTTSIVLVGVSETKSLVEGTASIVLTTVISQPMDRSYGNPERRTPGDGRMATEHARISPRRGASSSLSPCQLCDAPLTKTKTLVLT